jgi:hypothetical protein
MLLWGVAVSDQSLQTATIRRIQAMEIPVRMRQTRTQSGTQESFTALKG